MSALHLLWIITLSASFGAFAMALFVAAARADEHIYEEVKQWQSK